MSDMDLARLSDMLVGWSLLAYALAMVGYAVENAFGRRPRKVAERAAAVVGGSHATSDVTQEPPRRSVPEWAGIAAVVLTVLGAVLNAGAILTRGLAANRVPWGNMYEFALAASFVAVVVWLVVLARTGPSVRRLGGFVLLPVLLLLGLATLVLYVPAGPLVPALDSSWLQIHVSAAIIATGTFLVSFVASVMYLLRASYESEGSGLAARLGRRLPDAQTLDRVAHRTIVFAFPIWTFAVVAGAIWAESAWGRFWGWDPKETWSAISWLVYAGYLHARATAGWSERRAAWISIIGFVTMMINLFGVNFVVSGLHSYA